MKEQPLPPPSEDLFEWGKHNPQIEEKTFTQETPEQTCSQCELGYPCLKHPKEKAFEAALKEKMSMPENNSEAYFPEKTEKERKELTYTMDNPKENRVSQKCPNLLQTKSKREQNKQ